MRTPIDAPIHAPMDAPVLPAAAPRESFAELAAEAGPDPLPRIRATLRGDVLAVGLAGEFDHYTCAPLHRFLADGAARGARRLVLDAARVTFCDSALLLVLDRWVRAGGRVEVAAGSRAVRVLMELAARLPLPPGGGFRP
ncbi:STAS domain-containing protein [Streptomyces antarcticus]|uniref:STAS domain-containing protein n=1 Tax=Streptomyces antarcticus TaxID=2996458 RepID=UPI00226E2B69|nr:MULTISPECIES: STAS domain-containing protein [unclassified Streptomyces]MCY0943161.1 STAS domain-containing protein [Streptomyces sp. H34-AA3]MCZ4085231.1 STAS domain-containing protein [Streptomyces sp. H34-S5]